MLHVHASDDVLSCTVIKLYNKKPVFGKTGSYVSGRIPSTVWIIKCHTPTLTTSLKRDKTDAKMAKFKVLSKVMRMYSYSGRPRSLLTVALATGSHHFKNKQGNHRLHFAHDVHCCHPFPANRRCCLSSTCRRRTSHGHRQHAQQIW